MIKKIFQVLYRILLLPFRLIFELLRYTMIGLIRLYRLFIGPLLPPVCRFRPSCSQYFLEALQKKGLIKGTYMGFHRLFRCHPFCEGGYDPVDKEDAPTNLEKEK